jgi:hypothetical protein
MAPEARPGRRRNATALALLRAGKRVCARRQAKVTTLGFPFAAHETEPVRVATQEPAERAAAS